MMARDMQERDLSLTPRKEELRNARPIVIPIQFSLTEIKQHFENSLEAIKKQYEVADSLNNSGDVDGCKMIDEDGENHQDNIRRLSNAVED